jgi:hypothetical protein
MLFLLVTLKNKYVMLINLSNYNYTKDNINVNSVLGIY